MDKTPTPVRKASAAQALGFAIVNVIALALDLSAAAIASLNGLVAAGVLFYGVYFLHEKVTPVEGLEERLVALAAADTHD